MAFCKVCICGEKIVFARRLSYPDNCPSCGRKLADFLTYNEDDPIVNELLEAAAKDSGNAAEPNSGAAESSDAQKTHVYCLSMPNGKCIMIPHGECIIGRTEIGAEELSEYPSVSRKHLRIITRRGGMLVFEDISSYGTLVDGRRLEKNTPTRVMAGSTVTLCNVEMQLVEKEG